MRTFIIAIIVILLIATGGYFVLQNQGMLPASFNVQAAEATPVATPIQASNDVVVDAVVVPIQYAALSMASSGIVAAVLGVPPGSVVPRGDGRVIPVVTHRDSPFAYRAGVLPAPRSLTGQWAYRDPAGLGNAEPGGQIVCAGSGQPGSGPI